MLKDRYLVRCVHTCSDMPHASPESAPEAQQRLIEPAVPVAISTRRRVMIAGAVLMMVTLRCAASGYAQHIDNMNCRTEYSALIARPVRTYLRASCVAEADLNNCVIAVESVSASDRSTCWRGAEVVAHVACGSGVHHC